MTYHGVQALFDATLQQPAIQVIAALRQQRSSRRGARAAVQQMVIPELWQGAKRSVPTMFV